MGTDIHMRAEYFKDDRWRPVGAVFPYPYWTPFENGPFTPKPMTPQPYGGRNYVLFAVLADVRNGFGFAGVPTHKPLQPISEPRGLPDDMADHDPKLEPFYSAEEQRELAENGSTGDGLSDFYIGDHSFSWLTLTELLEYDWGQTLPQTGVVSAEQFLQMEALGQSVPDSWSGEVGGKNIVTISADHARRLGSRMLKQEQEVVSLHAGSLEVAVLGDEAEAMTRYFVQTAWERPLRDAIGAEWFTLLDRMSAWTRWQENTEDIRIVFGFDS